jgi:hypothetical protein
MADREKRGTASLYDTDILEWAEQQGALLRQLAERQANRSAYTDYMGPDEPDWLNIAEEIEDVGRSELHAVESLLEQALCHMLKAHAWPTARDVPKWEAEARGFRNDARRRFTPSMRQKIDLASLYDDARAGVPDTYDGMAPLPVPERCPVTLDELLSRDP